MFKQFEDRGCGSEAVAGYGAVESVAPVVLEPVRAETREAPEPSFTTRAAGRPLHAAASLALDFAPAAIGGLTAALLSPGGMKAITFGLLVWISLAVAGSLARAATPPRGLLPFVAVLLPVTPAVAVGAVIAVAVQTEVIYLVTLSEVLTIVCVAAIGSTVAAVAEAVAASSRVKRVMVVGSAHDSVNLARELAAADCNEYQVIGYVEAGEARDRAVGQRLGGLENLSDVMSEHAPDLLLVSSTVPRLDIFRQLSDNCLGTSARVLELTAFYEHTLGHVPIGAINDAWFQCVMHPNYARTSRATRACDIAVALAVAVVAAPLMLVLALLIRRDGGPVFYRQVRIGEGGRPFEILKLRSMREGSQGTPRWSSDKDPRVTAVGRLMRKTHVDEIPQILNVLRGEMGIVGPRPEQPGIVEQLEQTVPFYARRHLARPGVTGWAQVHCGYAGTEAGSAVKLSHDLYYLRHRSALLDLMILVETLRTLFFDRQFAPATSGLAFILPEEPAMSEAS